MKLAILHAQLLGLKVRHTLTLCYVAHASLRISAQMHWAMFRAGVAAIWRL